MNKDLINSIIEGLTTSTKNGNLEWRLTNSILNGDTSKRFDSKSADGLTRFEVILEMDDKFKLTKDLKFIIHNKSLVDGTKYNYLYDFPLIKELCDEVYDRYVKPNIVAINENDVLNNILGSIDSKQETRDKKINEILKDKDILTGLKTGLFDKFFGGK